MKPSLKLINTMIFGLSIGAGLVSQTGVLTWNHSSQASFQTVEPENAQDEHILRMAMKAVPLHRDFVTIRNEPVSIDVLNTSGFTESIKRWKSLTIKGNSKFSDGSYSVSEDKIITYSPRLNYVGNASTITCVAIDKQGHSYTFTVSGNVVKPRPSSAAPATFTTRQDEPVSIDFRALVTSGDGGIILASARIAGSDSNGDLKMKQGVFSLGKDDEDLLFTPNKTYLGNVPAITLNLVDSSGYHFTQKVSGIVMKSDSSIEG